MIYIFERLPINVSGDESLVKPFSKLKLNAKSYLELVEIDKEKSKFYKFFMRSTHDKNFQPSF